MGIDTIRPNKEEFTLQRELPKSELDQILIEGAVQVVRDCAAQYGGDTNLELDESQFHFVPEDSDRQGQTNPDSQNIIVASEDVLDKAKALLHETLHHFSWQSFYVDEREKSKTHRLGLRIKRQDGEMLFEDMNEAVTEILAIRLLPALAKAIPELEAALQASQNATAKLDKEKFSEKLPEIQSMTRVGDRYRIRYNAYPDERKKFDTLLQEAAEQTGLSTDEIENEIIQAYFSHDLRPLVKYFDTREDGDTQALAA